MTTSHSTRTIDLYSRKRQLCEITEKCKTCKYSEIWGGNKYMPAEYHCKLIRYKDHTGHSYAFPSDFLEKEDCPIHKTTLGDF